MCIGRTTFYMLRRYSFWLVIFVAWEDQSNFEHFIVLNHATCFMAHKEHSFMPIKHSSVNWKVQYIYLYLPTAADMYAVCYLCIRCTCTSPCTAPVPHPTPVMTDAHPMAKQWPSEPSDDQSKPLFSSLYQLWNGQCTFMKQLFMCSNKLILSWFLFLKLYVCL